MAAATEMRVVVRAANDGDVAALAALSTQLGYPVSVEAIGRRYAGVRAANAGEILVAEDVTTKHVVGWAQMEPRWLIAEASIVELVGLVVDESVRSAGVGAALLAAGENWARAQGFATLRVRSRTTRERAHRFYEREGYNRAKTSHVFDKML
jgi:GNAT superfamily N-acetyltransferase